MTIRTLIAVAIMVALCIVAPSAPAATVTHNILIFGDPQEWTPTAPTLSAGFRIVAPSMACRGADAAIATGDYGALDGLTQSQTRARYAAFLSYYRAFMGDIPTAWARGNHDCASRMTRTEFALTFGLAADLHAYYEATLDGIPVLVLSAYEYGYTGYVGYYGEDDARNSPQANWLVAELKRLNGNGWLFVAGHIPVMDPKSTDPMATNGEAARLDALFSKYGVDCVFGGHVHAYRRHVQPNGITYLTCGMAGGYPVTVTADLFDLRVFTGKSLSPIAYGYEVLSVMDDGSIVGRMYWRQSTIATGLMLGDWFRLTNVKRAP